ncbi:site-specific integrase [Christiangramia sp.]|uniref:tyrosine-type recombinase/integrase n=1 Tax=Christiangramia sp. TaxID=1931228 RepID=UPI002617CEA4|nr:site-specific integrase [Christiangramia sp.]
MKIFLPNNCNCSKPSGYPKNWKTCKTSALKKKWYLQYYFRDPEFKDDYPYGKLIIVKAGINNYHTLAERRAAIKALLEDEEMRLRNGWNPITNKTTTQFEVNYEIDPFTPASKALDKAFDRIKAAPSTISDLKSAKKHFIQSLKQLRIDNFYIRDIKRRHVRATLENLADRRKFSNARYNKIRAYVMMLFAELVETETIDINPVKEIKKLKTVKRIRTILTEKERQKIDINLNKSNYTFWRFLQIFFHSGCRITEILNLKKSDVNIFQSEFKVMVKKGRTYQEEIRAINGNVKHLWLEILNEAVKNDYLFSVGLVPGVKNIRPDQITRRWKRHVKDKLNITADFYALKHLHTDMIAEKVNIDMASAVNGHKSNTMAEHHYAVGQQKRILNNIKKGLSQKLCK